nr:hypothetical protein [uncultured Sphingomonas sp.]
MLVSASILATSAAVRLASLDLCSDEYLLLLARPSEIASVSRLAKDRNETPLWRVAAPYPANAGTVETLIGTRPNILISMGGGGKSTAALAPRLGMKMVNLPYPATPADVEANMVRVANAIGDPSRANSWRKRYRSLPSPRFAVDAIFLSGGGYSLSKGSVGDQWMRRAGLDQRSLVGGKASLETLAVYPPKILLRSSYRAGQRSQGQAWLAHPLANPKQSRIVDTDGRLWTCAGPLMINEIERLQKLL